MYCPKCFHPNPAQAEHCGQCQQVTAYLRERIFLGQQFIFVQADDDHPVALKVDDTLQTYRATAVLSRHRHAVAFGEAVPAETSRSQAIPLPDQPRLASPAVKLLTVITDRKIYKPETEAGIFILAPGTPSPLTPENEAALEIRLAGQKVYEAKVLLNREGLALHRYADIKEGEYTVIVRLPDNSQAECTFSAAEFTLSPLIATLEKHEYASQHLKFSLKLLLLSMPYSGDVEFGLQCQVCGGRVVATQKVKAKAGEAGGDFDLSGHGGPFHVQLTTPGGHTALVSFPGTGAREREHIRVNPLGQTVDAGLLPWAEAQSVRGLYLGAGEVNMTPLMLESAHAARGRLKAASDLASAQVVVFNPRTRTSRVIDHGPLQRGDAPEFETEAPYTLFTVAAFTKDGPFEGWGVVFRPVAIEATLTAPHTARPSEEIDVQVRLESDTPRPAGEAGPLAGAFCLLLVYDARLEHESPLPKLAQRIYESIRDAAGLLAAGPAVSARDKFAGGLYAAQALGMTLAGAPPPPTAMAAAPADLVVASAPRAAGLLRRMASAPKLAKAETSELVMVVAPTRMEFPELAYLEFFYLEGDASRTVKLGDQIGTWRARAYVLKGVDCLELTADVQADKPLYAELDVPAIAGQGDDILAAVNYYTREPADLVIATPFGETRARVEGRGTNQVPIKGPGRVAVRIENQSGADWSVRDVARPGVQRVTASRLLILDHGQTARGEKVVIYASMGQVLKDTITALIHYPFG